MTPKEKAKELVNDFHNIDSDAEMFDGFEMKLFYAQRCALIAVDELIKETGKKWWYDVKLEIEKL
jgi:hypothetical protein